jgi:hypothetical protein
MDREPGFYWIKIKDNNTIVIAPLRKYKNIYHTIEYDLWYFDGLKYLDDEVKVLSNKLICSLKAFL